MDNYGISHSGNLEFVENKSMKEIIISADSDSYLYSVPDIVAENLESYCIEFCGKWLHTNSDAEKFRTKNGVCYTEADFIDYLNTYIFPEQKSVLICNLGWTDLGKNLPEKYKRIPYFNF